MLFSEKKADLKLFEILPLKQNIFNEKIAVFSKKKKKSSFLVASAFTFGKLKNCCAFAMNAPTSSMWTSSMKVALLPDALSHSSRVYCFSVHSPPKNSNSERCNLSGFFLIIILIILVLILNNKIKD